MEMDMFSADLVARCLSEQKDEIETMKSMCNDNEFAWDASKSSGYIKINCKLEDTLEVNCRLKARTTNSRTENPGYQLLSEYSKINHLPPMTLHFELPALYPAERGPLFTLSSCWLNFTQLSDLCKKLDQLWEETRTVVLFIWWQFLQDCLEHLKIDNQSSYSFMIEFPSLSFDNRAIQDVDNPMEAMATLVSYNKAESDREFMTSVFDCEICYSAKTGTECLQLTPCGHVYCLACLGKQIEIAIKDGSVTDLKCPNFDCKELIQPHQVKEAVSNEMFTKYDELLLKYSLNEMSDIFYCPRPTCGSVSSKDCETNMALCSRCSFAFCIMCQRSWHGPSPCLIIPSNVAELKDKYLAATDEEKRQLEMRYGKATLRKALEEHDSAEYLASNSKMCPSCGARIEKTTGCNKMTCQHCGDHFCWLCGKTLFKYNPYSHFRTPGECEGKLFEGLIGEDEFI